LQKWNERAKHGSSNPKKRERDVNSDDEVDDVIENIPPAEAESSNHEEIPTKKQKLVTDGINDDDDAINDIIDATPVATSNPKSKLSAFAYAAPE